MIFDLIQIIQKLVLLGKGCTFRAFVMINNQGWYGKMGCRALNTGHSKIEIDP